jgi:hypothetical protein
MSENDNTAIALLVILVIIFLVPIGLILLTFPAEPYHVVTGEPVREAAQAAGVQVINTTEVTWNLPGAMGGKIYVLGDDAGNTLTIQTQKFDSSISRDMAIVTFSAQSVGKGKTIGTMVVVGDQVIHIGPDPGGILKSIGSELKSKRAAS